MDGRKLRKVQSEEEFEDVNWEGKKVIDLKKELGAQGLPTSGLKKDLVKRLKTAKRKAEELDEEPDEEPDEREIVEFNFDEETVAYLS